MQTESLAGFRISPQQERIVAFVDDAGAPTSACLYECVGPVDVQALRAALVNVLGRHEILRTVFRKHRELKLPLQMILDEQTLDTRVEDLTGLSSEDQRHELRRRFAAAAREFRTASEVPVVSSTVFRLSDGKHALLLAMPSLCVDAASFGVLAEELRQVLSGEMLAGDLLQYVDVTEWQHDLLDGSEDAAVAAKMFWRDQVHTPLLLPLEAEERESGSTERVCVGISRESVERLRAVAEENGVNAEDVLLTAWHLLLSRVTGEARTVVLTASDGREYDEIKNAVGPFSRYLPVTVDFEGKSRFDETLRSVAALSKQGRSQQDWFAPGSSAAKPGIGFEFHDLRGPVAGGDSRIAITPVAVRVVLEKLKLRLIATDMNAGLSVDLEYDSGRYSRESMEQLASSFEVVLAQALTNPRIPVGSLSLLAGPAKERLLAMGAGISVAVVSGGIHLLISAQGLRSPGAEAVRSGGEVLTYAEMEGRANRLAHWLVK
ncbi:MAG: condensation domain-containing protein, partial [Acidobacteriota bacterium]|nr:condensation domain-containing protein [Acidobacteriota bacterium]